EELLRLQALGPNTPTGVPGIDDEIMACVRQGKQRGHLLGVGRNEAGSGRGSGEGGDDEDAIKDEDEDKDEDGDEDS
ncbi:hypothetical protein Tco_0376771, partial [Tanacetum coccineum]